MDDIVDRLRNTCTANDACRHAACLGYCLPLEAADEIERLRAAGDALVDSLNFSRADIRAAVAVWQEARRG